MTIKKISFSSFNSSINFESDLMQMTGCSRSQVKRLLNKKQREIKCLNKKQYDFDINVLNVGRVNPKFEGAHTPKILFENKQLLFIHKPQSIHNYPLSYNENDNVLSYLREVNLLGTDYLKADKGLVNRLDFLTSGILVYAKNQSLKDDLMKNRSERFLKKEYLAIVHGKFAGEGELIERSIISRGSLGHRMSVDESGTPCRIHVSRIDYNEFKDLSLVKVELYEGLRHQIRILLSSSNHSIYGDTLYGGGGAIRMFLHHYHLAFKLNEKVEHIYDENVNLFQSIFPSFQLK